MFVYCQSSGKIWNSANAVVGEGYSGFGEGKNNHAMQAIKGVGPIPIGFYSIGMAFDDPGGKGDCVMRLTPGEGTDTLGRDEFLIHGDGIKGPGCASHGCIIMPLATRQLIANHKDPFLYVQA